MLARYSFAKVIAREAVTVAVYLRGKCAKADVVPYIVAQVIGAVAAAVIIHVFDRDPSTAMRVNVGKALVAEFLFTFALCWVVLQVATSKGTSGNSHYGLAIGFTVLAGATAVGGISGGAFNPAVAVGAVVMGAFKVVNIWIYLVANFGAAVVAATAFKKINGEED